MVNRDARSCYPGIAAELRWHVPRTQRSALAVRCRAGAVTNAGVLYDPGSATQHCVLHRARETRCRAGRVELRFFAVPEQAELRGVARGLGETEMAERVRGEQPPARGALQIAALDQERLDDVLDRIARLRQCRRHGLHADRAAAVILRDGREIAA